MAGAKSRGLGKGLEALFGDMEINVDEVKAPSGTRDGMAGRVGEEDGESVWYIDINDIKPNANQPRKQFSEDKIEELAASITEHGIIQPLVVRKSGSGYEIVAGERRWRAARRASLKKIPCLVRELTEEQNMLLAIIENMQREDLNPIEEAEAIGSMINTFGLTQEQVSKSVGKSRPYITNALRLLKLPNEIQELVLEGKLTTGHARALINVTDAKRQLELAKLASEGFLSVREIEKLAGEETQTKKKSPSKPRPKSTDIVKVEEELKDILGTRVNLNHTGKKGKIEIEYYSRDELERLIEMLRSLI